jgi:hypothetical protein
MCCRLNPHSVSTETVPRCDMSSCYKWDDSIVIVDRYRSGYALAKTVPPIKSFSRQLRSPINFATEMSKRKDASESSSMKDLTIKIIETEIAKNKKMYMKLPEKLLRVSPPPNSPHLWFGFGKQWHPIGLFDSSGKLIISKNTLQMEISNQPPNKDEFKPIPFVASAVATKGVYWFSVSSAFVGGAFTYKFTSQGANSLIHRCEIDDGDHVSTISKTAIVEKPTSKGESGSSKLKNKRESVAGSADVDNSKDDKKTEAISKKQKLNDIIEITPDSVPNIRTVKAAGSGRSSGIGGISSPVPSVGPRLSHKSRIERMTGNSSVLSSGQTSAKTSAPQIMKVKGPILEIALPVSLTIALLDDRARVDSDAMGCSKIEKDLSSIQDPQLSTSLSVTDLLNKVQQRAKHVIADCELIILRIRQLFECLFETSILYSTERTAMKVQLSQMRADRLNYADNFGGIYLLRLLVLIVTGADSIYPPSTDVIGYDDIEHLEAGVTTAVSSSSSIAESNFPSTDVVHITNPTNTNASSVASLSVTSQSSKSRRSAVMNKHHKMEFYKFQEVIDCALKELDESAHTIF